MVKSTKEADKEMLDSTIARTEEEIKTEEEKEARIQELKDIRRNDIMMTGYEVANFLTSLSERRIQELEREADAGIISEERLQKEKSKLQKRAAIINKAVALFDIAINTAVAVTKVPAEAGILGISLIPFIIANGIASAAAVIAKPIPQYEKGTKSSKKGPAVVGEKGAELGITPSGKMFLTPDEPSLMDLQHGTEILPADVTRQILKYTAIANGFEGRAGDGMIVMIADKLDRLENAIKGKPVASSTLTPGGILTATHRGNTTIKKLDKYFK